MLVGAAELFVTSIEHLAHGLGVDELVLTLVIAPLATELPETINSLTWIRQGKDTLALGNITGAMVFQSMLPVAFGLVFTDWQLTAPALGHAGRAGRRGAQPARRAAHPRLVGPFIGYSAVCT